MEMMTFFAKGAIDLAAAIILTFIIYKKRYGNKQLAVGMLMLNVFVFSIMSMITVDNFGLQAGLGLFAILSIFRFRSENFEQMDIAYFFGAVALATVNGITPIGNLLFVVNGTILVTALLADISGTIRRMQTTEVTLDTIPPYLFNEEEARSELSSKFGIKVQSLTVNEVDFVRDTAKVRLQYIANARLITLIGNGKVQKAIAVNRTLEGL